MEYLLTLPNTHFVIAAEKVLNAHDIKTKPMPLPRSLGDFCGVSLRIAEADLQATAALVKSGAIEHVSFYQIVVEQNQKAYLPWKI